VKATEPHPSPCIRFFRQRDANCQRCTLRSSALFADLPPAAAEWATGHIENGIMRRGGLIYRIGEVGDAIYTVRVGVVKLVLEVPGHEARIVRLLGRGATLGLERLAGQPYAHTAIATRTTNLCRIPNSVVNELHRKNPSLLHGLMVKWNEQITWADRWIGILGTGQIDTRIVDLVRLVVDISGDPLDAVQLPATGDIAAILGVKTESASRHMAELKRKGLLLRVAPWTYRCDPALLESAADPPVKEPHDRREAS
jgi:CRP-like cAMP-binding protein